jgi:hypothetical protein
MAEWSTSVCHSVKGSSYATSIAPHEHVIRTRSPSTPPSRSPHLWCSRQKASRSSKRVTVCRFYESPSSSASAFRCCASCASRSAFTSLAGVLTHPSLCEVASRSAGLSREAVYLASATPVALRGIG